MKVTKDMFDNVIFPEHWLEEGADPTNSVAKDNAFKLCQKIFDNYKLIPNRIASTIESGIFVVYEKNEMELIIETYNDGDVGIVVTKDKEILHNEDIVDLDINNALKLFLEN